MKKVIAALALAGVLAGCTNENAPTSNQPATEAETNNPEANETQVIDVEKQDTEESKAEEATDYKAPNEEEAEVTESEETEESAEEQTDSEATSDEESSEAEEDTEETAEETSNQQTASDGYFYLPYSSMVSLNEDGVVVDENGNDNPAEPANFYTYVKYTNNIFVKNNADGLKYSIVRVNGNDFTTLYDFPENEEFRPLGMIGDVIYGYHSYYEYDQEAGYSVILSDKSAIGAVDLTTGEVHDFAATKGVSTGGATVIEGELQYTAPGDNYPENAYNYDLYKLDLAKGYDQEAELIEKDFDLQYLFGQKRFINGAADWNIRRADNENIYVGDAKFPFLWAEQGYQDFIGNNIFYFTSGVEDGKEYDPFITHMEVVNVGTGQTVLDTKVRGIKLQDGKLYYITEENNIESIDIEL